MELKKEQPHPEPGMWLHRNDYLLSLKKVSKKLGANIAGQHERDFTVTLNNGQIVFANPFRLQSAVYFFSPNFAWAAASLAIGTLGPEQET